MSITVRPYDHSRDYQSISEFLMEIYLADEKPGNWLQPRWEYMHSHPLLDRDNLHEFGIWQDGDRIVGIVHYESVPGEAFFQVRPGYDEIKADMLSHAEQHLCHVRPDGRGYLRAIIADFDSHFESIASERGYRKKTGEPLAKSVLHIPTPFPDIVLPEGFQLLSLANENDLTKIDRVLWRGFDHPGEPPEGGERDRERMQSAPNFAKDLNIVVKAPNGDYASYSGIWFEPVNKFAYVEPVATDPDYRRLGIGKAAVMECIRRCAELGATIAYVGSGQEFYKSFGFTESFCRYPWTNVFDR